MTIEVNVGDVFTRLTVIDIEFGVRGGKTFVCKCECGNTVKLEKDSLVKGHYKSCGCLHKKHGMYGTRIYNIWFNMKSRCTKETQTHYEDYGGRGIEVCEKWMSFKGFYEDMKDGYSDNLTLDRIDVNGNYEKENCRWADSKTQMNNMRSNRIIEYNGERLSMSEFADKYNLDYHLFRGRILKSYSVEEAMKPKIKAEKITYKGETKRVRDFAEDYGLTYNQLKKRLERGWNIEKALTQPLKKRPTKN